MFSAHKMLQLLSENVCLFSQICITEICHFLLPVRKNCYCSNDDTAKFDTCNWYKCKVCVVESLCDQAYEVCSPGQQAILLLVYA